MYHDDEFIWLTPQPKNRLTLVIPNENYIIIRPALQTELPAKASIGYIPEKRVIAFRADENGFTIPKIGRITLSNERITLSDMTRSLVEHGLFYPAYFSATRVGDRWYATLDAQQKPALNLKKPPRRKKKRDLERLAEEADSL